jgi:hypothetical protein
LLETKERIVTEILGEKGKRKMKIIREGGGRKEKKCGRGIRSHSTKIATTGAYSNI